MCYALNLISALVKVLLFNYRAENHRHQFCFIVSFSLFHPFSHSILLISTLVKVLLFNYGAENHLHQFCFITLFSLFYALPFSHSILLLFYD